MDREAKIQSPLAEVERLIMEIEHHVPLEVIESES